jgi:hypothetical protein
MSWRESVTIQPSTEPVTLAEAKVQARVDLAYTAEDAFISGLIVSARRQCETHLKSAFIQRTILYLADSFPFGGGYFNRIIREAGPGPGYLPSSNFPLQLPTAPLASVTSIQYLDSTNVLRTLDPSLYVVSLGSNAGRITPAYAQQWPTALNMMDSIRVTYVAGASVDATTVPENVKAAIKILVAAYFKDRESVGSMPDGVKALLSPEDPGYYS